MLDRDGNVFAWRGDQFGGAIDTSTVSPHLVNCHRGDRGPGGSTGISASARGARKGAIRINLSEEARAAVGTWRIDHHAGQVAN